MDLMKLGAQLLASKMGGNMDSGAITSVLGSLMSDKEGNSSLGGIMSLMQEKGLGSIASSWLGDGDNEEISSDQVRNLIGDSKVSEMASQLNTDENSLLDGLKDALPQLIDKSSSGGSLLDSVGGLGGALNMAKKLF